MASVRLARMAMASRFELILEGENEAWLRAAGEEALSEIERLDRQLTIFSPASEVSRLNARAAHEPVSVEPRLFHLLQRCKKLSEETAGAFDITVAPLMRAWGFYHSAGRLPAAEVLERARQVTGMHLVHLDADRRTVSFEREGVLLDFGAVGKGYAVDEAIAILREAGVASAFLHGGTSTAYGIGTMEDGRPWRVALPYPDDGAAPMAVPASERAPREEVDRPSHGSADVHPPERSARKPPGQADRERQEQPDRVPRESQKSKPAEPLDRQSPEPSSPEPLNRQSPEPRSPEPLNRQSLESPDRQSQESEPLLSEPEPLSPESDVLAVAPLEDVSLSVSAVWGKAFELDGKTLGHVLDPRRGRPVEGALMTAVIGPSAAEADALSTALLVLGRDSGGLIDRLRGRFKTLLLFVSDDELAFQVIESEFPTIPSHRHREGTLPS